MMNLKYRDLYSVIIMLAMACLPLNSMAMEQELAAKIQFARGDVTTLDRNGQPVNLEKDRKIYPGNVIITGENSMAQLLFKDRSRLAIRSLTEFSVDTFSFDPKQPDKPTNKIAINMIKGAMRSITGIIGTADKSQVVFNTPVATIGIRGTDHEIIHIPKSPLGGIKSANLDLGDPGTYNKVYSGGTVLKTQGKVLNINVNQVGFISSKALGSRPQLIKSLPKGIEKLIKSSAPTQAKKKALKTVASNAKESKATAKERASLNPTKKGSLRTLETTSFNQNKRVANHPRAYQGAHYHGSKNLINIH